MVDEMIERITSLGDILGPFIDDGIKEARKQGIYERALESIAANTCCDGCREAALVAKAALDEVKALDPEYWSRRQALKDKKVDIE